MNCRYDNLGETALLTFTGELTAHCSEDLIKVLLMSLGNSDHLVVDLKRVTVLDPSCKKMFSIACKTSLLLKKKVTMTGMSLENFSGTP